MKLLNLVPVLSALLFALPAAAQAEANNCSPIASLYHEEILGPPPLQHEAQWCFAYASANLISMRLGHRVSAKRMAYEFHQRDSGHYEISPESVKLLGGYVSQTLLLAMARGTCSAEADIDNNYLTCEQKLERFGRPVNYPIRSKEGQDPETINVVNKVLERNSAMVLGLDLGFMLGRGRMLHAVTLVGREFNAEKQRCEYLAVDSNDSYTDIKEEFRERKIGRYLILTGEEIQSHGLSLDFLRK